MIRIRGPKPDDVRELRGELVIGREGADLVIEDSEASRRHALVRPLGQVVEIEDLGSLNGTFVNGKRIEGTATLTESGSLRIGQTEFQIEIEVPQPTRQAIVPPADPTRPHALPEPEVTRARQIPEPEVTRQRPIPEPGVTRQRAIAEPEATRQRAVAPDRGAGAGEGAPPGRRRRVPPILVGGLLAVVVVAAIAALVLGGGGAKKKTTATATSSCAAHFPKVISDGFPEPPMVFSHGGVLDETLTAAVVNRKVGTETFQGMAYNGITPGPTLVMCPGDHVTVRLDNRLPVPTNLHVHGLHVSPTGAGDNIFIAINPLLAHTYSYQLPSDHPAGAYWYHPHFHPLVDIETTAGMLGAILVGGGLDNVMPNIPQRLIIIHGGKLLPPGGKPLPIPGLKPSQVKPPPNPGPAQLLVNGALNPTLHIRPGEIQRWRIWNATGERELRIALPGVTFQLLAQDGNTLRFMRPLHQIVIGAGSRVEVLVRGGPAGSTALSALPFHTCFRGCFDPFGGIPQAGRTFAGQTLLTVVSGGATAHDQMPTGAIGNPADLRQRPVDVRRTIVLARVPSMSHPPTFPINSKLFDANRVDITMKLNSVEEWTLKNPITASHDEWHTFHIHQNPFQVVSINGRPLDYVDWEDNINLAPGETAVIRMNPRDFTGKFVFHCHLTFHEDHGMMAVVQVLANPTPAQVHATPVLYMAPPDASAPVHDAVVIGRSGASTPGLSNLIYLCHLLVGSHPRPT